MTTNLRINHTYLIVLCSLVLMYLFGKRDHTDRTLEFRLYGDYWKLFLTDPEEWDDRLDFWEYRRLPDEVDYEYYTRTFLIFRRKLYVDRVLKTGERN